MLKPFILIRSIPGNPSRHPYLTLQLIVPDVEDLCDVVVNPWGYLVWSSKLQEVLAALTSDPIQYLPVIVRDLAGNTSETYMLANPLAQVDAVDEEHSSLLYNPDGYIEGVNKLVLKEKIIGKRSLFRLSSFSVDVIVRENVAKEVDYPERLSLAVTFKPITQTIGKSDRNSHGHPEGIYTLHFWREPGGLRT